MINIFVTYRCNLKCPYCFARDLRAEHEQDMSMTDFERLLDWMKGAGVTAVGFIGGEPTLHPSLPIMLQKTREIGIAVTLFSNGLFPSDLVPNITPYVDNFVINYNDPRIYASQFQEDQLHQNLKQLFRKGCRLTFSKNFFEEHTNYDYLIEGAKQYGVRNIRYDISRPSRKGVNVHYAAGDTSGLMKKILCFVRECENEGIKTGMDCCMKNCDLREADRRYLERVSMKFTGFCHPSIDIQPNLSASYCLPMSHIKVPEVTAFSSRESLLHHFATMVRPFRFKNISQECNSCRFFKTRCQGGCLATKEQGSEYFPGLYNAVQEECEVIHG